MKALKTAMMGLALMGLIFSLAYATGSAENGMILFNNPKLSGSMNDKSCNSCHPGGQGLAGITEDPQWASAANADDKLATVINQCITKALGGNDLSRDSEEMQDMIAYIKSLK